MKLLLLMLIFTTIGHVNAQKTGPLERAYETFRSGDYHQTIKLLSTVENREESRSAAYYLKGLCYNKIGEYDKAASYFDRAIKAGIDEDAVFYELGQVLYANNQFTKARIAFSKSIKRQYKIDASMYYLAYISQLMDKNLFAIKIYRKIDQLDKVDSDILQASNMQWAECMLKIEKERRKKITPKYVQSKVIPQMGKALKIDDETPLAQTIKQRIYQLEIKYRIRKKKDERMGNGRKIPVKRYMLRFTEDLTYDDNVIEHAKEAPEIDPITDKPTLKSSYVVKTAFFGKYHFVLSKVISTTPELRIENVYHTEQGTDAVDVYKNDSYDITGSLKNRFEHKLFGKMSSLMLDYDYQYTAKDYNQNHTMIKYGYYNAFTLGETIYLFKFGESTLSFTTRNYRGYTKDYDSDSKTFKIQQNAKLSADLYYVHFAIYEKTTVHNKIDDTNTLNLYNYLYISNLFKKTTVTLGLNFTQTDYVKQPSTRGKETRYNPNISFKYSFHEYLSADLHYGYTNNDALNETQYAYSKHEVGLKLELEI